MPRILESGGVAPGSELYFCLIARRRLIRLARINRLSFVVALVFSGLAFLLVMANVITEVPPQPGENASAHVWQLLMILQLPLIILFLVTADWRSSSPALLFAIQLGAMIIACGPVWLAGF